MTHEQLAHHHHLYKRQKRRHIIQIRLWQWSLFFLFFIGWEIASTYRWIDPLIFSAPSNILSLLIDKIKDGTLLIHVTTTLLETIIGFLIGTLLGTFLATCLWWSKKLARILDPYLVILNAMPKVALGPIIIVALGPHVVSVITMGVAVSVIITTIVIYSAFNNVDPNYVKVIQSFGGTTRQQFSNVILPASFPTIISTLKVNVGLSWVGVIVGEFLVSEKGLGYMIIYGFQVFNFTLVLLSLVLIALLASGMYQLVALIEKKMTQS